MKPSYPDSSVFLVPLKDGGFARGVVARTAPGGKLLLGYFFGPRLASQTEANLSGLESKDAVLSLRFGDLGLLKGLWPVVGKLPGWNPAKWPMPNAVRRDPLGKTKPILIRYDDNDPSRTARRADRALKAERICDYFPIECTVTGIRPARQRNRVHAGRAENAGEVRQTTQLSQSLLNFMHFHRNPAENSMAAPSRNWCIW